MLVPHFGLSIFQYLRRLRRVTCVGQPIIFKQVCDDITSSRTLAQVAGSPGQDFPEGKQSPTVPKTTDSIVKR